MTHWPKTLTDVIYRLCLLRRLTLISAGIIIAGGLGAEWISAGAFGFGWASVALAVLIPAMLTVLFPAAWIDILAFALAMAATCLALSSFPMTFAAYPQLRGGVVFVWLAVPIVLTFALVWLIASLHGRWPLKQMQREFAVTLKAPADRAMDHEFLAPDQRSGERTTGPADETGVFPVYFNLRFPDPVDLTYQAPGRPPSPSARPDAFARIIERGPTHQITQVIPSENALGTGQSRGSLVVCETVTPVDQHSCRLHVHEVHDIYDLFTWVLEWLIDHTRDYMRDLSDTLAGRPTPAVRGLPQVTPMTLLARGCISWGLADPGTHSDGD